jgi:hypothetical protein
MRLRSIGIALFVGGLIAAGIVVAIELVGGGDSDELARTDAQRVETTVHDFLSAMGRGDEEAAMQYTDADEAPDQISVGLPGAETSQSGLEDQKVTAFDVTTRTAKARTDLFGTFRLEKVRGRWVIVEGFFYDFLKAK